MADVDDIIAVLDGVKRNGDGYLARCPAHDDRKPSFSIKQGFKGPVFKCYSGCSQEAVQDALKAMGVWGGAAMSESDRELSDKRNDERRAAEKAAQVKAWGETAARAEQVWKWAKPVTVAEASRHKYLQAKMIETTAAPFVRMAGEGNQYAPANVKHKGPLLVIPITYRDKIVSVQFIAEDGTKAFLAGSKNPAGHRLLGELKDKLWLCEGFATGCSLHFVTGDAVAVCFNTGGMKHVASQVPRKPATPGGLFVDKVQVMADDDWAKTPNAGIEAAEYIERRYGIGYSKPVFLPEHDRQPGETDFNDAFNAAIVLKQRGLIK